MSKFSVADLRTKAGRANTSTDELYSIYRQAAKVADQRLVRLEKLATQKNFKGVKKYAYRKATYQAMEWGGNPDKPRFNIKPPKTVKGDINREKIRAKIMDILDFLDKPTSTKAGILNIYQKRADTLNKTFADEGLHFTWQDVGNFFESTLYKKMDSAKGSGTIVKAFAAIQHDKKAVLTAFKSGSEQHIKVDNIVVQDAIDTMLESYPKETRALLNKIK